MQERQVIRYLLPISIRSIGGILYLGSKVLVAASLQKVTYPSFSCGIQL